MRDQIIKLADELRELDALRTEVAALREEVATLRHERDLFHAIGGGPELQYEVVVGRIGNDEDFNGYWLEDYAWGKEVARAEGGYTLRQLAEDALQYHAVSKRAREIAENSEPLWAQREWVVVQATRELSEQVPA